MAAILKKVIVRSVGVLKAFETPNSPKFEPLTTIYARNGRGKSTFSAILHSAATNNPAIVAGRKTLTNAPVAPEVTLVFESGPAVRFVNGKWSQRESPIEVFDANFIAENLFAGEAIDLEHDRGLFSVILGRQGVKLGRQQNFFNGSAKKAAAVLKDTEKALNDDIPQGMSKEEFFAYSPPPDIDDQITQAQKDLKAVQQADRLARLRRLEKINLTELGTATQEVLGRTVPSIEASARERLAVHFTKFKLGKSGEEWIKFGREHIHDDGCPFCGKAGVDENGLMTLYSQIFGEEYQAHFNVVRKAGEDLNAALGPDARAGIQKQIAQNSEAVLAWSEYFPVNSETIPKLESQVATLDAALEALKPLFDAKRQTPLAAIPDVGKFDEAARMMFDFSEKLTAYNEAIQAAALLIEQGLSGPRQTEQQSAARLQGLIKRKRRAEPGVHVRIEDALRAKRRDMRAKSIRTEVQNRLKAANEAAATHYHRKVNDYLTAFGATFLISKIDNSMTGNIGSVDYGLIVRGHHVERGRGRNNMEGPNFRTSLSTGDKTTLAFAFFLAGLDRDGSLADKIVVFDDPLSSHDTHRTQKTIEILKGLCRRCAQLIVLSHDAYFLRLVAKRCAEIEQVAYQIDYQGNDNWSEAKAADLDELCIGEHALHMAKLHAFYERREGIPNDVAPAVRKVLETHYRRTYTAYFQPTDNLGPIIRKIRDAGPDHPCVGHVGTLEACNEGTMGEHHGENPTLAANEPIDADNLHTLVRDCLKLIHALPQPGPTKLCVA